MGTIAGAALRVARQRAKRNTFGMDMFASLLLALFRFCIRAKGILSPEHYGAGFFSVFACMVGLSGCFG
jgi:hypothetical protein